MSAKRTAGPSQCSMTAVVATAIAPRSASLSRSNPGSVETRSAHASAIRRRAVITFSRYPGAWTACVAGGPACQASPVDPPLVDSELEPDLFRSWWHSGYSPGPGQSVHQF